MTEEQPLSVSEAQLNDLDERVVGLKTSLRQGFLGASAEQHLHLEPKLKDLQKVLLLYEIIASFRKALKQDGETAALRRWTPKGLIEEVIQVCCHQLYGNDDIEYIFYKHGGFNGLMVLYLGTRFQTSLFAKINMLPPNLKEDLAKKSGEEKIPSDLLSAWWEACDKSSKDKLKGGTLPRLYQYSKRKKDPSELPHHPRKRGGQAYAKRQTGSDTDLESTKEPLRDLPPPALSIANMDLEATWGWVTDPSLFIEDFL